MTEETTETEAGRGEADGEVTIEAAIESAADVVGRRDEVVDAVSAHAGSIARELALLAGEDDGTSSFRTDAGTWTLRYEAGDLTSLRFEGGSGGAVDVVSPDASPEPDALTSAMADYDAFVAAYNRHVASLDGVLDDVSTTFPEVASTEGVARERERLVSRIRETADAMAGQLHRADGTKYGTFATTVDGARWELKWEGDLTSYLRVGGDGGRYLLSQYGPPSTSDLQSAAADFGGFVDAYNEHVAELEADIARVTLDD